MKLREGLWSCLFGVILMLAGLPFSSQVASHDQNGNQIVRNKGLTNQEQALNWDAENRLAAVIPTR